MTEQHLVMLPFMAQGHLIPILALAKLITRRHPFVTITLATTPLNIRNLSPPPPPHSPIHLYPLPFTATDHNLPAGTENTDSLSFPTILNFYPASESLRPHFDLFLANLTPPPTGIIADVFTGWSVESAASRNIFHATFTTSGAYGTAVYFSLYLHHPHIGGADEFSLPGLPPTFKLHHSQISTYIRDSSGTEPWRLFFKRQISLSLRSSAMICNTVEELESEGLRLLRSFIGSDLRVFPVGPLLPLGSGLGARDARAGKQPGIALTVYIEWLDEQLPTSVVYVCFGSQNTITETQMAALAAGLEGSGCPFIWVVRPPLGSDMKGEVWLPEGLEERVGKRGLVVRGWAPQLEILSHPATGVFVSHCGWNSVLESLSRGVPIVGWPLASEQFYNAPQKPGFLQLLGTQTVSAVWHGLYPGYIIFFVQSALMIAGSRVIYRLQQSVSPKYGLLKKIMTFTNFAYTVLVLNYSCIGFMVLSWHETLAAYKSVYYVGTIVPIIVFVIGKVVKPARHVKPKAQKTQ